MINIVLLLALFMCHVATSMKIAGCEIHITLNKDVYVDNDEALQATYHTISPMSCISDCCEKDLCSVAVFARQDGNSVNCYHYDCWQYECFQFASNDHYVYDVKKNIPDDPPSRPKSLVATTLESTSLPTETEMSFSDSTSVQTLYLEGNMDLFSSKEKIADYEITTSIPVTSSQRLASTQSFPLNKYNFTTFNEMKGTTEEITTFVTSQASKTTTGAITSLENEPLSSTTTITLEASTNSRIFNSHGSATFNTTTAIGFVSSTRTSNQSSIFEYDIEAFAVFRRNYGILVSFVVFGFLITITTTVVMWKRLKESLRNYRYRHYRKIEYLVNDRSYA